MPGKRGTFSIMLFRVTTAYPALQTPCPTKELPSIKWVQSGFFRGISLRFSLAASVVLQSVHNYVQFLQFPLEGKWLGSGKDRFLTGLQIPLAAKPDT